RIPRHSDSRSADIRTWIPGHPDNLAAAAERELLMSVVTSRVKVEGLCAERAVRVVACAPRR
ncbi:MAG: hypothetical protein AAF565_11830, partial [Pseudomonadota bacterium]